MSEYILSPAEMERYSRMKCTGYVISGGAVVHPADTKCPMHPDTNAYERGVAEGRRLQRADDVQALEDKDALETEAFDQVTKLAPQNWDGWPYAHPYSRSARYLASLEIQ